MDEKDLRIHTLTCWLAECKRETTQMAEQMIGFKALSELTMAALELKRNEEIKTTELVSSLKNDLTKTRSSLRQSERDADDRLRRREDEIERLQSTIRRLEREARKQTAATKALSDVDRPLKRARLVSVTDVPLKPSETVQPSST